MAVRAGNSADQGVVSTSPSFFKIMFQLDINKYKTATAESLCADPFFQEWVFYPLGPTREFFLDLLIGHSRISMPLQIARARLLHYSQECSLIAAAMKQYTIMKAKLENEPQTELSGYAIIWDYWTKVREQLEPYEFASSEHEIQFFKVIKPLFTAEAEYYSLLHHAELFAGDDEAFWRRQPMRLDRFIALNAAFVKAYTAGETRYDGLWFRRGDKRHETSHDPLAGNYLGMLRYQHDVEMKLKTIGSHE
jgi:hypothetical protein